MPTTRKTTSSRSHSESASTQPRVSAKNVTRDEAKFLEKHADALSRTTLRAKWIHTAEEHEDKPGQSLATREHEVIQHWADERGAHPATIAGTEHDNRPGVLRFDFPGYEPTGRKLQEISWDQWFSSFDSRELVFIFQEHKRDGSQSNFFQLDNPRREDG